jgi:hypothetical protein
MGGSRPVHCLCEALPVEMDKQSVFWGGQGLGERQLIGLSISLQRPDASLRESVEGLL